MKSRGILALVLPLLAAGCVFPTAQTLETDRYAQRASMPLTSNTVMQSRLASLQQQNQAFLQAAQELEVENARLQVQVDQQARQIDNLRSLRAEDVEPLGTALTPLSPQLLSTEQPVVPFDAADEGIGGFEPMFPPADSGMGLEPFAEPFATAPSADEPVTIDLETEDSMDSVNPFDIFREPAEAETAPAELPSPFDQPEAEPAPFPFVQPSPLEQVEPPAATEPVPPPANPFAEPAAPAPAVQPVMPAAQPQTAPIVIPGAPVPPGPAVVPQPPEEMPAP